MREGDDAAPAGVRQLTEPRGALHDLLRGLAARAAVAEEVPVRALAADLGAGKAFVVAVVVLEEQIGALGACKARKLRGLRRAPQRAGEGSVEAIAPEDCGQGPGALFAFRQQRQVGAAAGVPPAPAPFGGTVSGEPELEATVREARASRCGGSPPRPPLQRRRASGDRGGRTPGRPTPRRGLRARS